MTEQLTLELGILTDAQQERVNSFIRSQQSTPERIIAAQTKTEALLISGGFKAGIDYVNDLEHSMITEDRKFGYGSESFIANVTYMRSSGGCKVIYDRYNSVTNQIITSTSLVSNEHDKLECSAITSQYRAYKPASLLTKLKENNENAQNDFDKANATKSLLNYTVNKYKTLFPKATVNVGRDYYRSSQRNYVEFETVVVTFESGSYIIFRLGYENDKEYIHKKFDAVTAQLSAIELLEVFNKQ
jgi:allophanate hydrolase subunit 1